MSPKLSSLQSKEFERAGAAAPYASAIGSERQENKDIKTANEVETHEQTGFQYLSDGWDVNEQHMKKQNRKGYGADESNSWKDRTRNDVEELYQPAKLPNGGNRNSENTKESAFEASRNRELDVNKHFPGDYERNEKDTAFHGRLATQYVSPKGLEVEAASFPTAMVQDSTLSAYMSVLKDHNRGDERASHGQELIPQSFGAARLWPLDAMLYRRFKRGPISTANYERRKLQNEEFGIEDKFVRSSSGWWEKRFE